MRASHAYTLTKTGHTRWDLSCLYCDYDTWGRTERDTVAAYRVEYEDELIGRLAAEFAHEREPAAGAPSVTVAPQRSALAAY